MNLVLFDFDGTVTKLDTTLMFAAFIAGQRRVRRRLWLVILALVFARLHLLSNTGLKKVFARLILRGQTQDDIRRLAGRFYHTHLDALADHEILGRLRGHVDRGDQVYLVSANFGCLIEPLVARWSLSGVVATEAGLQAGVYTGGITGAACHGHEKLQRTIARFGRAAVAQAVAYGNQDDAPLLRAVGAGYLVRRAGRPGRFGRFRRWVRLLSGELHGDDLATGCVIEPFPAPDGPRRSTGG